jgi:hypothetical protein
MIISIEIPDATVEDTPVGLQSLLVGKYIRGVARQVEDNLSRGKVAVGTDAPLVTWELLPRNKWAAGL